MAYNQVVCSDGNLVSPTVMVIGEAPGKDEVFWRKPFVGKSGKYLRATLNEFGLDGSNTVITNVIPCRPQDNKFPKDDDLIRSCAELWLFEEISILQPKAILVVGGQALKILFGESSITSCRGVWRSLGRGDGVKCLPTYHPSYVLRKKYTKNGYAIQESFRMDIMKAAVFAGVKLPFQMESEDSSSFTSA